jgi:general secretion pathway protein I
MSRFAGFTLLEVLIALAVLALAMTAILGLAGQSVRVGAHLSDRTAALWVAENLTVEAQLFGVEPARRKTGDTRMLGRQWRWTQTAAVAADERIVRVETRVFPGNTELTESSSATVELVTFVRRQ